ncbi:PepSY-associated TM helix domain-containing protein [Prauserella muralis]|uniref:Peptidase n=1 Tax=Prauserella muralis TaxID=588067 RepID=A0A2V4B1I7_9PSEU|nr:peptidase [Prauserella muralis]TWE22053.1 putative iron-regulated membrane protein [Prauserella muralis]
MPTEAQTPTVPTPTEQAPARSLLPLLRRLHFYAGILVGPFLLVAALTGLLYVFAPHLEQAIYDHELRVPAAQDSVPLAEQVAAAEAALPEGTLVSVRPAPSPTDTTQVILDEPGLAESYHRTVFVNPHDGEVRGVLETYGSSQALPVRAWLDQLHRSLHLGDVGRIYSELAASWLWVVVLGGLVLWWGKRRRRRVRPDRTAKGRARTLSWHGATGTWVALVLLFLSATGLTWSQYAGENVSALREALSWETPSISASAGEHAQHQGSAGHTGHAGHTGQQAGSGTGIGPDGALAAARTVGLDDPVEITVPANDGEVYVVTQTQRHWPTKQDSAAIDPATGQVLEVLRFDDYPLAAKLARWGIDGHMGLLFGLPNQLVLATVCLAVVALVIWGYRMWWQRRPTQAGFGKPFPRGAWRSTPPWLLVVLVLAAAAVGWFLPLLGISLLGFLVLDALLGLRRQRAG